MRKLSLLLASMLLAANVTVASAQTPAAMTLAFSPGRDGNQGGTVTVAPMGGQTKVSINMPSGGAGVQQPAHIHVGGCPGVGAVVFPLTNVVDGKSETTVNVSAATIMGAVHAINVHKSTAEAALYVACTDLPYMTATSLKLPFGPGRDGTQPGTVTLADAGAQTRVTIAMVSGGAGVQQPAHIHVGGCPGVGAVVFPLTNVVDGKSETTVNVTRAQAMARQHAVNVHRSTTQAAVYVACTDIPLAAQAPAQLPRTGGAPFGLLALLGGALALAGATVRRRS